MDHTRSGFIYTVSSGLLDVTTSLIVNFTLSGLIIAVCTGNSIFLM